MKMRMWRMAAVAALALSAMAGTASASAPDSRRMERAKEYFADEQWSHAIAEFQAVANDLREANRDEALFWLAQSEHETGDHPAAIQTIVRLERQYPKSRWVRLARSLRVEIAQRLNRDDVLWAVVVPPPSPPAPRALTPRPPVTPAAAPSAPPAFPIAWTPPPASTRPPLMPTPPRPGAAPAATPPAAPTGTAPPAPPAPGARPRPGV